MLIFLCIYLVIGLAIALWSTSEVIWDEQGLVNEHEILVLKSMIRFEITMAWPSLLFMAIKYKDKMNMK